MKTVTVRYSCKPPDKFEKVTGINYGDRFLTIGQKDRTIKISYIGISKIEEKE